MHLFLHNNKWYLWVAEYYGKFPWMQKLSITSTKDVISALKFCFSVLGTPDEVICYSGTPFASQEYKEFTTQCRFTLTASSANYPRGHGFIKRQVQTIKNLSSQCSEECFQPPNGSLWIKGNPLWQQNAITRKASLQQAVESNSPSHHQASTQQ